MTNIESLQIKRKNAYSLIFKNESKFNALDHFQAERLEVSLELMHDLKEYDFWQYKEAKEIIKAFISGESFDHVYLSF